MGVAHGEGLSRQRAVCADKGEERGLIECAGHHADGIFGFSQAAQGIVAVDVINFGFGVLFEPLIQESLQHFQRMVVKAVFFLVFAPNEGQFFAAYYRFTVFAKVFFVIRNYFFGVYAGYNAVDGLKLDGGGVQVSISARAYLAGWHARSPSGMLSRISIQYARAAASEWLPSPTARKRAPLSA